ncbi:unnamed protein product [Trifolium pratense]|uniref:Uncharacterized protein n=1 Tax=Trifolium pratense TaxID=57577 RepID=A0ACB0LNF3_TRIPR|nr:unnamed protein product [Trifolium pratense]
MVIGKVDLGEECKPWFSSSWWRDICSIVTDCWGWRPEKGEEFTVRSTYGLVLNLIIPRDAMPNEERLAFKAIWKGPTPSKVSGFAWMLLHDRVPTRVNLYKCRIIQEDGDQRCVFCGQCAETVTHLFLYCSGITQVWHRVCAWLGLHFLLPHSISSLLNFFATTPGCKQLRQGLTMIWNAVIWVIWRHRNSIIFYNGVADLAGLVDEVKIASWKWWIGKSKASPCLFYEWNVEPEICLKR